MTTVASPYAAGVTPPYSLVGTGLVKTADVGGSRFGQWSAGAFSPMSYVQTTVARPIGQLSAPVTYPQMATFSGAPAGSAAAVASAQAPPWSPRSPTFVMLAAIVVLLAVFVAKRKRVIK